MSTYSHHLNKLGSTRVLNTTNYVSLPSVNWLCRIRFFYFFFHLICEWWPCCLCDLNRSNKIFVSLTLEGLVLNLFITGPSAIEETFKIVEI